MLSDHSGNVLSVHDNAVLGKLAGKSKHWARIKQFIDDKAQDFGIIAHKRRILADFAGIEDLKELAARQESIKRRELDKRQARIDELMKQKAHFSLKMVEYRQIVDAARQLYLRQHISHAISEHVRNTAESTQQSIAMLPVVFKNSAGITDTQWIDFVHALKNPSLVEDMVDIIGVDGVVECCGKYVNSLGFSFYDPPESAGAKMLEKFKCRYGRDPVSLQSAIISTAKGNTLAVPKCDHDITRVRNHLETRRSFESEVEQLKHLISKEGVDYHPQVYTLDNSKRLLGAALGMMVSRAREHIEKASEVDYLHLPTVRPLKMTDLHDAPEEAMEAYLNEALLSCSRQVREMVQHHDAFLKSCGSFIPAIALENTEMVKELHEASQTMENLENITCYPKHRVKNLFFNKS